MPGPIVSVPSLSTASRWLLLVPPKKISPVPPSVWSPSNKQHRGAAGAREGDAGVAECQPVLNLGGAEVVDREVGLERDAVQVGGGDDVRLLASGSRQVSSRRGACPRAPSVNAASTRTVVLTWSTPAGDGSDAPSRSRRFDDGRAGTEGDGGVAGHVDEDVVVGPGSVPPSQLAGSSQKPPAGLIQSLESPVSVKLEVTSRRRERVAHARSVTSCRG